MKSIVVYCHVIEYDSLPTSVSPPLGAVTVTEGAAMIQKAPSLTSVTVLPKSLILTMQVVDGVSGTVQENVPEAAVTKSSISVHVDPSSLEYSIERALTSVEVHVILCDVPTVQCSPPFGDVTVIVGGEVMVKFDKLREFNEVSAALEILIRAVVVGVLGTVHEYEPAEADVLSSITLQFVPPLLENSILIFATYDEDQVISWMLSPSQFSPPLGEFNERVGGGGLRLIEKVPLL